MRGYLNTYLEFVRQLAQETDPISDILNKIRELEMEETSYGCD